MKEFKNRSFLTLLDYTPDEITALLDLAASLKQKKKAGEAHRLCEGKQIALIFEKTSTRTRCAFEVAAADLGMHSTYLDPKSSQIGKKESIADTARVLGRMYDAIEYRGFGQEIVDALAQYSGIPVLNGLTKLSEYCVEKDVVMIHDATHPYLDSENLGALIEAVKEYGGATMASKNYDTVYRMDAQNFLEKVEPRELIVAGASPEAFRFGDIFRIYRHSTPEEMARMTSAGAIALAYHIPMKVIPSPVLNLKITYPQDFELLLKLLHGYFFD